LSTRLIVQLLQLKGEKSSKNFQLLMEMLYTMARGTYA
jgi:hypothetical protein